jgi:hypothetical protein
MILPHLRRATAESSRPRHARVEISGRRRIAFRLIVALMAVVLPLLTGEIALRIIYRDGGTRTIGGPGGQEFVYYYIDKTVERRAPIVTGPKAPGTERILVQGDSITWGWGVRDWRELYANRLLEQLNATGRHFDMEVNARGGQNIDAHERFIEANVERIAPDYVIYQWYNNDVEVAPRRPRWLFRWEAWSGHSWLVAHSYLYYVVSMWLENATVANGWGSPRSYSQYLLEAYAEGTPGWTYFADQFHRWATYATAQATHVLVCLYPQVPFRGTYPLEPLESRMRAMATTHRLTYPASWLKRQVGEDVADPTVRGGRVRRSNGREGLLIVGPNIPLRAGHYEVTERLRLDQPATGTIETIAIVADGHEVARRDVAASACHPGEWTNVTVAIDLAAPLTRDVEWRVTVAPGVRVSVDEMSLPIRYEGLEVLDLADRLNTFNTHASLFDSHPNARAHAEVAKALAEWILSKTP